MKRLLMILIFVMIIVGSAMTTHAAVVENGQCGEAAFWSLDDAGTLHIFGEGDMYAWSWEEGLEAPWYDYKVGQITSIVIEEGITNVGDFAFENCVSVTTVSIPDSVTKIGDSAFNSCSSLERIEVPGTVKTVGERAFAHSLLSMGGNNYESSLKEIVLSEGIETIGYGAFFNCVQLETITFPASVTSLGQSLTSRCTSLREIIVKEQNQNYSSQDGVLYNKDKTELLRFPAARIGRFCVPNGVEIISESAFYNSNAQVVILPESVKEIGKNTFQSNIHYVVLPKGLEKIGTEAFYNNESMNIAYLGKSSSWSNIWDDTEQGFLGTIICSGDYIEEDGWAFADGILTIDSFSKDGDGVGTAPWFQYYDQIEQVVISEGVTHIGAYAFAGCYNLKNVQFPSTLESIGKSAFWYCSSLSTAFIPDSVTSIGTSAFAFCETLSYCHLPQELTTVSGHLFENCTSLKEVVVPDQVTEILESAFSQSALTTVTLPMSIQKIEDYAFLCPLKRIYYHNFANRIEDLYEIEGVDEMREDNLLNADFYGTTMNTLLDENELEATEILLGGVYYRSYDMKEGKVYGITANSEESTERYIYPLVNGCVKVTTIGADAISGNSIKRVTIPASIKTIEAGAFKNSTALEEVRFAGTREEWEKITIGEDNAYLSEASIVFLEEGLPLVEQGGIVYYLYSDHAEIYSYSNDFWGNVTIPDSIEELPITSIAEGAFSSFEGLTQLILTDNIKTIDQSAFSRCENLASVSLPNGLKRIEDETFEFCYALKSMDIPDGVVSIGCGAFRRCESLETVTIPASVVVIEESAFATGSVFKTAGYDGTSEEWEKVSVATGNEELLAILTKNDGAQVSGVSLNKTELDLCIGETETLVATIAPADAKNKAVVWESSDETVATVENGLVIAKGNGMVTITVTTEDGDFAATCLVTVRETEKVTTSSSVINHIIMVTPTNAQIGNCIIVVCYKENEITYIGTYSYNNETTIPFVPDVEYERIKIMVWESLETIRPLSDIEEIAITQ